MTCFIRCKLIAIPGQHAAATSILIMVTATVAVRVTFCIASHEFRTVSFCSTSAYAQFSIRNCNSVVDELYSLTRERFIIIILVKVDSFSMQPSYRPHYASCPSVCQSVRLSRTNCPSVLYWLATRKRKNVEKPKLAQTFISSFSPISY